MSGGGGFFSHLDDTLTAWPKLIERSDQFLLTLNRNLTPLQSGAYLCNFVSLF